MKIDLTPDPLPQGLLEKIADRVGTPYWLYNIRTLRKRVAAVQHLTQRPGIQSRFAMKACPATRVLTEMQKGGIWIDAVSGNEVLRARRAGFSGGMKPPEILFTTDVFRDNALEVLREHEIMPNIGSPGMCRQLHEMGYNGPISIRANPGFGHGHVNACDTGGPSSKHGIWMSGLAEAAAQATQFGMQVAMLHAHIGSGPKLPELLHNLQRLVHFFAELLPHFPEVNAVSLGGGIPHNYRNPADPIDPEPIRPLLNDAQTRLSQAAGRDIRVEIEPGRFFIAPVATLVTRVTDIKKTQQNEKGRGATFAMVDAGFNDLIRPAMYGSYHRISISGKEDLPSDHEYVVAGPLCESGDVFTRDESELLVPRALPAIAPGDLLLLHDAGAYGYAMSSNYNSIGRAPQLSLEEDGTVHQFSRRETIDDLLKAEATELVLK